MPLTDIAVRSAKPKEKPYRLFDSGGLYLEVSPSGGRWWRLKYRVEGKEKRISLGTYPEISLKEARESRDEARKLLAKGVDPSQHRKEAKAAKAADATHTFEAVAKEWLSKHSPRWANSHATKVIARLEKDIFPLIGSRPVSDISGQELLSVLTRIEARGALDTVRRANQNCSQVFRYAIASGRAKYNPCPDLRGALAPVKHEHFPAITNPKEVGGLLRAIDSYKGTAVTKAALQLAPLVFVRPKELRTSEWAEIDLVKSEWSIPASKMKMGKPHLVPLSKQAIAILRELQPLTGSGKYVFPCAHNKSKPMSDNAILAALRRMGFAKEEMTGHGFRAMARTLLDEVLQIRTDYIELQLAHTLRNPNGQAYNRTAHLDERKKMMQIWADYLDRLRAGAEIIPITKAVNT